MGKRIRPKSIFDTVAKVTITRDPPRLGNDGDIAVRYHTAIDELETIYSAMVIEAGNDVNALEEALGNYDRTVERIINDIAAIYSESGLGSSGVGGKVQEHQDALYNAALDEQQRVILAKAEQKKLQRDLGGL